MCSKPFSQRDQLFLVGALGLTLVSDWFMVLKGMNREGLTVFPFVQWLYSWRHMRLLYPEKRLGLTAIFGVLGLLTLVVVTTRGQIILLGAIYAFWLVVALVFAWVLQANDGVPFYNRRLILWGMSLFFLCDVNVLLFQMLSGFWSHLAYLVLWICYLPSQIVLGLSGRKGGYDGQVKG